MEGADLQTNQHKQIIQIRRLSVRISISGSQAILRKATSEKNYRAPKSQPSANTHLDRSLQ